MMPPKSFSSMMSGKNLESQYQAKPACLQMQHQCLLLMFTKKLKHVVEPRKRLQSVKEAAWVSSKKGLPCKSSSAFPKAEWL